MNGGQHTASAQQMSGDKTDTTTIIALTTTTIGNSHTTVISNRGVLEVPSQTSSISTTRELARNADSLVLPQNPESEMRGGVGPGTRLNKLSGDSGARRSVRTQGAAGGDGMDKKTRFRAGQGLSTIPGLFSVTAGGSSFSHFLDPDVVLHRLHPGAPPAWSSPQSAGSAK